MPGTTKLRTVRSTPSRKQTAPAAAESKATADSSRGLLPLICVRRAGPQAEASATWHASTWPRRRSSNPRSLSKDDSVYRFVKLWREERALHRCSSRWCSPRARRTSSTGANRRSSCRGVGGPPHAYVGVEVICSIPSAAANVAGCSGRRRVVRSSYRLVHSRHPYHPVDPSPN
jgi:hypothetical protein